MCSDQIGFFFASRRRHTIGALVTGVQTWLVRSALRRGLVAFGPIACSVAGSRDKEALLPDDDSTSLIGERLRFGSGFTADDHAKVTERLSALERRLSGYGDKVDLEISVKVRDTASQRVVLDCQIAGQPRSVATSTLPNLDDAITEVREDLIRQLNVLKTRSEPRRRT